MKKNFRVIVIISSLILSGLSGFIISFYLHAEDETPRPAGVVGDVQLIETYHYPSTFVNQLKGDPNAGQKIFKQFCTSCHGNPPIIDIKAPRINDKKAWQLRRKMGMSALMKLTTMGVGAMPARGGCFECSDEQLRETIQYILDESQ
jgi:cytochrome c5